MKKIILFVAIALSSYCGYAQNSNPWPVTGGVGIGTTNPVDLLHINAGAYRKGITITSDGDANAYTDITLSVNSTASLVSGMPTDWEISHRKDGFFSNTPSGQSSLEFYANLKGGNYYAPLSFKSDGNVILVSNKNALGGNVGVGTTNPGLKLEINGTVGAPMTTGSTQTGILRISNPSLVSVLDMGEFGSAPYGAWLQATDYSNLQNTHPLIFNPNGGNIGIGTANPQTLLDARSSSGFATLSTMSSDGTGGQQFVAGANDGVAPTIHGLSFNSSASSTSFGLNRAGMAMFYADGNSLTSLAVGTVGNIPVVLGTNNSERMRITSTGNILIGSPSQINSAYKLDVYGNARANEIVVNSTGADFVFDKKYTLPKLSYVKGYIEANHHLPEIPSAKEMQTNGIELGEMNKKLLQKVEELTLYLIEKDKQLSDQQQNIKSQQVQIDELKDQLKSIVKYLPKK